MFSFSELTKPCVVISERGLQNSTVNKIKLSDSMHRIDCVWQGNPIACAYFPESKSNWRNTLASTVTAREIMGNAIVVGATSDDLLQIARPKTWANLASHLPKTLALDERARTRIAEEQAERAELWQDYYKRKARRKRVFDRDRATIDLATGRVADEMTEREREALEATEEAFAAWELEQPDFDIPDE